MFVHNTPLLFFETLDVGGFTRQTHSDGEGQIDDADPQSWQLTAQGARGAGRASQATGGSRRGSQRPRPSPSKGFLASRAKKWLRGDGFGRALAKKGLGSDETWPKSAPAVTIAK